MQLMRTPSGVLFGLRGEACDEPGPLLMLFGGTITDALTNPDFCRVADLLVARGWRAVAVDLPAHGSEVRAGETEWDMGAWRTRLEAGENPMEDLVRRSADVLDHCIAQGIADPQRIATAGPSRGGYSALHVAAADGRPHWVGAIAPLTRLTLIREFAFAEYLPAARALDVHHLVPRLVGKSVWLCIGNDDRRVGTDSAIEFTRLLVEENRSRGLEADVELHVLNYEGHLSTTADHDALAAWLHAKATGQASTGYSTLSLP